MHRYFHRSLRHTNLALFALFVSLSRGQAAHAATFTVDRTDDVVTATACDDATPNDCSLRGAILAANARPISEASTINVPAGTYVLSQSSSCTYSVQPNPTEFFTSPPYLSLCLSGQVTIQGAGAATTIIDGGGRGRVLFVGASAVADLRGVTIANGLGDRSFGDPRQVTVPDGGGIVNQGTFTLTDSVVRNNSLPPGTATYGAGIYNIGVLTLLRSAVSNNNILQPNQNAGGGGIFNEALATLTVADSTISDNMIGSLGGGIADGGGTVTITGSTISGNRCDGLGGGSSAVASPALPAR